MASTPARGICPSLQSHVQYLYGESVHICNVCFCKTQKLPMQPRICLLIPPMLHCRRRPYLCIILPPGECCRIGAVLRKSMHAVLRVRPLKAAVCEYVGPPRQHTCASSAINNSGWSTEPEPPNCPRSINPNCVKLASNCPSKPLRGEIADGGTAIPPDSRACSPS